MKTRTLLELLESACIERGRAAAIVAFHPESPTRSVAGDIRIGVSNIAYELKRELERRTAPKRTR